MWQIKHTTAAPITVGDLTVTPEARSVIWHGPRGGVVWSAPSAVLVERNGRTQRIPIVDIARIVQGLLLGTIVAVPIVQWWLASRQGGAKK